jgi:hypothetical protein
VFESAPFPCGQRILRVGRAPEARHEGRRAGERMRPAAAALGHREQLPAPIAAQVHEPGRHRGDAYRFGVASEARQVLDDRTLPFVGRHCSLISGSCRRALRRNSSLYVRASICRKALWNGAGGAASAAGGAQDDFLASPRS